MQDRVRDRPLDGEFFDVQQPPGCILGGINDGPLGAREVHRTD
jgi:hypothetical protein